MSATFQWNQRTQSTGEAGVDIGITGNLFNFKNNDGVGATEYYLHPISKGENSYEVWNRVKFTGLFNNVSGLKFWLSAGELREEEKIVFGTTPTFSNPDDEDTEITTIDVPTEEPETQNVFFNGLDTLTEEGFSDYIVLQYQTTSEIEAGDTDDFVFSIYYDEN